MKYDFLSILSPNRCAGCGEIVAPHESFCGECASELEFIKVRQHKNKNNKFDSLVAAFYYKGAAKRMILRYKFYGKKYLYKTISKYLADEFEKNYNEINFDYITYIPMTAKEYMRRGFNQTKLLAKCLSKKTGIKCKKLLRKTRNTKSQARLNSKEREKNLKDCFEVIDRKSVRRKTVLLLDDVKTTGATLNECSKMLRKSRVKEIYCITVAIAEENEIKIDN